MLPAVSVLAGASVWGLYWIAQRGVADTGFGAGWAAAVLNLPALAAALVVGLGVWREIFRPPVLVAGFCFGAGFVCYAIALVETSVVRATLLFYLTPIWGTILGIAVMGEKAVWNRWVAIALAVPGLALILGLGSGAESADGIGRGEAYGLASGVIWTFGAAAVRHARGMPVRALGAVQYSSTVLLALLAAMLMGEGIPAMESVLSAFTPLLAIYALAVLAAFYLIYWAMAFLSPGRSGLLMMSEVVVAVISAAILLPEESLSGLEWAGAALILAAGVIEVRGAETG